MEFNVAWRKVLAQFLLYGGFNTVHKNNYYKQCLVKIMMHFNVVILFVSGQIHRKVDMKSDVKLL